MRATTASSTAPSFTVSSQRHSVPLPCPSVRQLTASRGFTRASTPRTTIASARVDSPYQVGSQADSAGSIPVTRSTREKRCNTSTFDDSSSLRIRTFGLLRATLGHTYPHLGTRLQPQEDAQLVPHVLRPSGSPVLPTSPKVVSPPGALEAEMPVRLNPLVANSGRHLEVDRLWPEPSRSPFRYRDGGWSTKTSGHGCYG